MTKYEWERQLKKGISSLPKSEQHRVLDYYAELFADKIELNMREEEIISEFGNPYDIANRLIVDYYNEGQPTAEDEYVYSSKDKVDFDDDFQERRQKTRSREQSDYYDRPTTSHSHTFRHYGKGQKSNWTTENVPFAGKKKAVDSAVWGVATILFFIFGAFGFWHPAWMLFLGAIVVSSAVQAIATKNPKRFNYPALMVVLFLLLGFYGRLWHPMWLLFVTIPFYYSICASMTKKNTSQDGQREQYTQREQYQPPRRDERRDEIRPPYNHSAQSTSAGATAGGIICAILLAIVFIYISIVVWTTAIGLFAGGLGMVAGGVALLVVSAGQFANGAVTALALLGSGLLVFGLGLLFSAGTAVLFKYLVRMCKSMTNTVKRLYRGQASA